MLEKEAEEILRKDVYKLRRLPASLRGLKPVRASMQQPLSLRSPELAKLIRDAKDSAKE